MEFKINKVIQNVQNLVSHIESSNNDDTSPLSDSINYLKNFLKKESYNENDIELLLRFLSDALLVESLTIPIALAFKENLLLLVTNAVADESTDSSNIEGEDFFRYQWNAIALAKLMQVSLCVKRYALCYFSNKPPIFSNTSLDKCVAPKKAKKEKPNSPNNLDIVKCCYLLLKSNVSFFKELWNWSDFLRCYTVDNSDNNSVMKLYVNHTLALLTNMSALKLGTLNEGISEELLIEFANEQKTIKEALRYPVAAPITTMPEKTLTIQMNSSLVTNVEGVILPIFNKANYEFYSKTDGVHDKIVRVDSTKVNLRSIALGTTAGKAICLSGPVGCGKTTLVEYLARKIGRVCPKSQELEKQSQELFSKENKKQNGNIQKHDNKRKTESKLSKPDFEDSLSSCKTSENGFLRVQLGDQTDCKMLLGQYHCTDVPGEFIWLPGVLTQAVLNGYWLLLEDLDSATTDTFTILSSLLENQYLSVPGFRDCVKIAPGFQLFVTVRTNRNSSFSSQKALFSLLEKYLYTINVLPLSRNELCKVVSLNYTKLATVANRIVDVFLTFSKGDHGLADNLRQQETEDRANTTEHYLQLPHEEVNLSSVTNSGRLVSTRDLIKLCQRSNPVFSVTSIECAYFVFQNAVDIFCSYLPNSIEKTKLITSIGAKLGIIQSRCEHYAVEYKPEVQLSVDRIKVGRVELCSRLLANKDSSSPLTDRVEEQAIKRLKLANGEEKLIKSSGKKSATFSFTRLASCLLERVAVCVSNAEPILLVGETGVGKTSSVQYLAEKTKHKLVVINMNNQSDVSDLVGGFKPVDLSCVIAPLRSEFEVLFRQTFNQMKNESFLTKFSVCYNQGNYSVIVKLMLKIVHNVFEKSQRNELRDKDLAYLQRWSDLRLKLQKLNNQLSKSINISFAFITGSLVKCIKNGDWVLLDEINLASAETLECLSTILEPDGSVVLLEKGDFTPVKRHPDFRIFACMNPNTDIGKKDLSVGIRNRFTEFFVDEVSTEADLSLLISDYLSATGIQKKSVMNIVKLYKRLKQLAKLELNDGLGNRPVYSLRTLCRSLCICAKNLCGSIERNLYEAFCLSFLTQLDPPSHNVVEHLIKEAMLSNAKAILNQAIPKPGGNYLNFEGYWIQQGPKELEECSSYILTESVKANLKDLSRIISIGKLPILLQGPTSAGKTSLIDYVARRSGNHCLRINNHEHTDLQEYIGTYTADVTGKLTFREGVLVQAMRNGYWIILDELNLASTEILEALNRVLDDNRELFIPETQTVVKAHTNFMLFATQNPPGLYGGRKTLSRAFKNRFIELHFSDIPRSELETILEKKCLIPPSYARKMVACMEDLQKNRKTTSKNVFTLRDLFRWGVRYTLADKKLLDDIKYDWNQHLIEEGYLVLSAKVRTRIEIEIIEEALYKNFKKRIDLSVLFDAGDNSTPNSLVTKDIIQAIQKFRHRADIVWTRNMSRMAVLTAKALKFNEPVLLVGPTGCGKTTVCQILSAIQSVNLRILNCHMHTEGADFLGGLRPCRKQQTESQEKSNNSKLFEWTDGPLIESMQEGSYFMADEISLAEDSVLERLNCVLEPERTVLLAEKGGLTNSKSDNEIVKEFVVTAKEGFQFLATMNPGGDFGKKELSPALRNRFTEIWCEPSDSKEDLIKIASNCILNEEQHDFNLNKEEVLQIAAFIVDVVMYMKQCIDKFKYSVRDILAMANFIVSNNTLSFPEKAIFGLETIFLDALEMLSNESLDKVEVLRLDIIEYAVKQACVLRNEHFTLQDVRSKKGNCVEFTKDNKFGIKPFFITTNIDKNETESIANRAFLFDAPTTKQNLFRLLSALSLQKPVLLEGPPGVGKTSIVENLAQAIGYNIVRINLCEHTDLADLFGTDLPAEDNILNSSQEIGDSNNAKSPQIGSFVWRDGPLLAALKADHTWILLDELNLAPQSVLEGLNAILDHRGEVYIPELNKTFALNHQTRIFACQNPLKQGGGRKGLPQSFLNRFTKVYVRKLTTEDLLYVVDATYNSKFENLKKQLTICLPPSGSEGNLFDIYKSVKNKKHDAIAQSSASEESVFTFDLSSRMVRFSETLDRGISSMEYGYKGGPYEINLRDILRWCDLLISSQTGYTAQNQSFVKNFDNFLLIAYERMKLVYYQRMRCDQDKQFIRNAFAAIFQCDVDRLNAISEDIALYWTHDKIYVNDIVLERDPKPLQSNKSIDCTPLLLGSQREALKNIIECVHMEKPVLLCGSTDTGKTKLVDVLCRLSNQKCNTDNIDDSVTGSFQQIDLNRHLEEIAQQVEAIYLQYIQDALIDKACSKEMLLEVFEAWNKFCILSNAKCDFQNKTVVSEELVNYRKRIAKLSSTIDALFERITGCEDIKNDLNKLRKMLSFLNLHVENTDTLNTGGHFEWVDSQIVKSLKCGQYISLEHVNLCSSAVLDRLNPVFEPNGTLMLSEKGVSSENKLTEIVEKAKNFRAFLTIDPKNGELSRAMRNRCIELSLTNKCHVDVDDKRLLVYNQGIHDIKAINCIISIHDSISTLSDINNFTISHLTQMAFLVAAYGRIGYQLHKAIYVSAMEVYVYSAHVDLLGYGLSYYQDKLREIVAQESRNFESLESTQTQVKQDYLKDVILDCNELNAISLVKMQLVPLKIVLNNATESSKDIHNILAQVLSGFENMDLNKIDVTVLVKYLVYIIYETSSINDLKIRYLLLKEILQNHAGLSDLSRTLYETVEGFVKTLQENSISPNLPWNAKLLPRIRDYTPESMKYLDSNAFSISLALIMNTLLCEVPQRKVGKISNMDAITYSQAVAEKKLTDKLNNDFLKTFSTFIHDLETILKLSLKHSPIAMESFMGLVTSVLWFNRIVNVSQANVFVNKELNPELMDKLVLHFKWLDKHLLQQVQHLLTTDGKSSNFEQSLAKLHSYILSVKHPLNLTRKLYAKQMMQFQPFYREDQIQLFLYAQQTDQLLELIPQYGSFSADNIVRKFVALSSDSSRRVRALVQKFYKAQHFSKCKDIRLNNSRGTALPAHLRTCIQEFVSNVENDINGMQAVTADDLELIDKELTVLAQSLNVEKPDEMLVESVLKTPNEIEILLMTLKEYFVLKYATTNLQNTTVKDVLAINVEYYEDVQNLSNTDLALLSVLQSSDYKLYRGLWFKLLNYISSITNTSDMDDLLKYLNGGYRLISSAHRLLTNSLIELQQGSLSSRGSFISSLRNNEDLSSINNYYGPAFINSLCDVLLSTDGSFKSVPLKDLDMWRNSLEQLNQILWHNSVMMTPTYNNVNNNVISSIENGKRILLEVDYVQMKRKQQEPEDSTSYMEGFQKLLTQLKEQVAKIEAALEVAKSDEHISIVKQNRAYEASLLNTLTGAIELCLLTFTPLIDPVEKSRLKHNYLMDDIECLTTLTKAYDFLRISMKYKHLGHEIYDIMQAKIQQLTEKQIMFEERVALRPEKCLYTNLVKDLTHFLKTNCDPHVLYNFITSIQTTWSHLTNVNSYSKDIIDKTLDNCGEILNKIDMWIANSQRFMHHTMKPYYAYYQDFLQPIQCSISQLRFGFEGMKKVLAQLKKSIISTKTDVVSINASGKLHRVLQNIIEFPSAKHLTIFNVASSQDVLQNRCPIFSILDRVPGAENTYFSLLKAKLVELKNRLSVSHEINEEIYKEFDFAFNIINQIWQQEEERRRQKKKEEDSLYQTQTKCQEENEELQELEEIEEVFPTGIKDDFGEFVQEDTLEKVMKLDKTKNIKTKDNKNSAAIVKDEDYAFIANAFSEILINYTPAYYHPRVALQQDKMQFVDYFKTRLSVFARLYNNYKCSLNEYLDAECFNSLCFNVALQQDLLNENSSEFTKKSQRLYNFYKDSNVAEILNCTEVLNSIEIRVDEQLALYSEHATLLDIKSIIQRIRLLPSTASVVRFNTGFQLLRQKVAQWNEVAHKNNHLKSEEQQLAEYVQKWTRLELQFWRNCMVHTQEKVECSALRYWFFIYNLLQEYLRNMEINSFYSDMKYAEKRFEELETLEEDQCKAAKTTKVELRDILQILRQFIESSSYGDFEVRMQLLLSFEFYLHNSMRYSQDDSVNLYARELISGLHNLQLYFAQFSKDIEEYKKCVKAPIEKKLKELVKIESYNKDLSYFSMRNNVARVHRNLNKFLKEYEQLLKEKITPVFQPKDCTVKDYNFANDKGKDLRHDSTIKYCQVDVKYFIVQQKTKPSGQNVTRDNQSSLLAKVQSLFNTSRNVVKETVVKASYPKLIIALDSLLTQQLERCEHLRNLTVDRSKERPKQKLEAKQILQQKRKGLTDLFKILSVLGLNYKTGLMELSLRSEFENSALPPFCIKTMLSHLGGKRLQPQVLQLNENVDMYFNKCVFKLKLLQNIMLTPLSELGPPNIERIKGFAIDFFLLVQNQRQMLANTTKNIYDLHLILKQLKDLGSLTSNAKDAIDESHMDFNIFQDNYNVLTAALSRVRYVFEQFKLFLTCAPKKQRPENCLFQESVKAPLLVHNSNLHQTISKYCEEILLLSKSTLNDMSKNNSEFLSKDKMRNYNNAFKQLEELLQNLVTSLAVSDNEYLPIASPLLELQSYMVEAAALICNANDKSEVAKKTDFENIDPEIENVIHSMLIALQKLYKKYSSKSSLNEEKSSRTTPTDDQEAEDDDIHEQHLKSSIYGELKDDWHLMNIQHISDKLSNILITLKLSQASEEKIQYIHKLIDVQPLLEQFNSMSEYYLFQQLAAHKISVKILSIILTVFIEIGTKGFCVPQDLMQDEEGEKKKDQKEGEGFGLEDGTGEKDASDKIESEDQLDDAKRPEDRKEEKDQQDDCKEEKGIEMSEDFEAKQQDLDKPEEDDSGESEDEEELNKEMGETEEGADKLDEQLWGEDEEEPEPEEDMEKEEDGKGSNEEKDSHNNLDSKNETTDEGKDEHEENGLDATNEPDQKKSKPEKPIDDMKDQEEGDDQVNPFHNELEEPPEPEDLDLGDMNVDDKEENEDMETGDENPFDIDKMKDSMPEPEETQEDKDNANEDGEEGQDENSRNDDLDDSDSDDEDESALKEDEGAVKPEENKEDGATEDQPAEDEETDMQTRGEMEEKEETEENNEEQLDEKTENYEQSKDTPSKEENLHAVPENEAKGTKDQMQAEQTENDIRQEEVMDEQDTGEEKDGVGQAENDATDRGHQGIAETKETSSQEDRKNEKNTKEKRRQGKTNEERTLGEAEMNKVKQLKTIDKLDEQKMQDIEDNNDPDKNEADADEYQHVKDPKTSDKTTLDNATEEQSKKMQHLEDETKNEDEELNESNENMDLDETPAPDDNNTDEQLQQLDGEKVENKSEKPSKSDKTKERAEAQEEMEIEGDVVSTFTVPRSGDTTAHCNRDLLAYDSSQVEDLTTSQKLELRRLYQQQVTTQRPFAPQDEGFETWQQISNRMIQNARDLCEQLRLILEPTKCTRLKGDYRTGRRINMKKIIPYIASQFRKDKIWLRRTKPAQRDYKITIAIDDSKSMHHNNSKMLTLEAISLVSQALTLLESGRLSVVSFGEQPNILLNHTEQFDGQKLVNSLQFLQDKTKIAELLDFTRAVNMEEGSSSTSDNGIFENLLLVLSDGRNIYSEGKMRVKNAIKLARLQRIFLVYIIIDNPDNKNSILDIQTMEMLPDNRINIKSYLDDFPFPYYVIVRDLNQLPLVLSEAMRQWFELVNSEQ